MMAVLGRVLGGVALVALMGLAACQTAPAASTTSTASTAEAAKPVANPPLVGTTWQLVAFQSSDDAQGTTKPDDPAKYTLTLNPDGNLAMRLDCNRGRGPYETKASSAESGSFEVGLIAMTRALCPAGSMGEKLARDMGYVRSYVLRNGRLYLSLMADGGIYEWQPAPAVPSAS